MRFAVIRRLPYNYNKAYKTATLSLSFLSATLYQFVGGGRGENFITNLPPINFFEFRRLVNAGELDGVVIADNEGSSFTKTVIQICKFYAIPKVGIVNIQNVFNSIYFLDSDKSFIPYLETNLIDACNLNCKGCTHFSVLFNRKEIYTIETFERDIRILSQKCDVIKFRLLGGEPLLLKNLNKYIKISREYLPKTDLRIVTNGLLIPSISQKILDAVRENNCIVDISAYAPTLKIADKISQIFHSNKIIFNLSNHTKDKFGVFLTLHSGNNPENARKICFDDACRFVRNGKIYKCPIDALSYRIAEKFGIDNYPVATGIDIYSSNFSLLLPMLDGNIEMCHYCSEKCRYISWEPTNNPQLEDWLADPDEVKNLKTV